VEPRIVDVCAVEMLRVLIRLEKRHCQRRSRISGQTRDTVEVVLAVRRKEFD